MRIILIAVLVAACASAWATPIPGSSNELLNWDFESSPVIGHNPRGSTIYGGDPWVLGQWIAIELADPNHHLAAKCTNDADPTGLWMYQIVDETLNPLWRDDGTQKIVDLMVDIRVMGDHALSTISFQLGWWDIDYPTMPTLLKQGGMPVFPTTGFQLTSPVRFTFDNPGVWYTFNPFDQIVLPIQPRWLVVFVDYDQAQGEAIWSDNYILTSKCIPEPMSLMVIIVGLTSLAGFGKLRKK